MKLYRYTCGMDEKYGPAEDEQDAYDRREEVDSNFHFLPVTIEEVTLPGYVIEIRPSEPQNEFDVMDKPALKAWFDQNNIEYVPQWGEKKLREVAREHAMN